jgi:hypothetical protein
MWYIKTEYVVFYYKYLQLFPLFSQNDVSKNYVVSFPKPPIFGNP